MVGTAVNEKNCLATKFPEIAKTWHPTLNGEQTPKDVRSGAKQVAIWRCLEDIRHVFPQNIGQRTGYGKPTCLICNGRFVNRYNALSAVYPELMKEWDFSKNTIDPSKIVAGYAKKVHWICKYFKDKHRWKATPKNRTDNDSGCRYCNNQGSKPELRIFLELKTIFQDIEYRPRIQIDNDHSIEADIYIPSLNLIIEYDGSYFHKNKEEKDRQKNNNFEQIGMYVLRIRDNPLPKIGDHDVIVNESKLNKNNIDTFVLKIFKLCRKPIPRNAENYCKENSFQAETEYNNVSHGLISTNEEKSAAAKAPNLLEIYSSKNIIPLSSYSYGSHAEVWWKCRDGKHDDYQQPIKYKVKTENCPYCTGGRLAPENTLLSRFPEIASEWDTEKNGFGPDNISFGSSSQKYWWKCNRFNHSFDETANNRTNETPCPRCPKPGNSLLEKYPKLESQWHLKKNGDLKFAEISIGKHKKYWWSCKNFPDEHPAFQAWPSNMIKSLEKSSHGCDVCRRYKPNKIKGKDFP